MGGELLAAVAAGEAKIARQNAASGKPAGDGTSPACTERVSWPVEDPSEFRPELAPGGPLEDLGKQKDDFRVYYEVCALTRTRSVSFRSAVPMRYN